MSSNTKSYDTNLVILRNAFAFSNATIPVSTNYQLVISGPNGYAQFQDSMKILSNYSGVGYLPDEFSTFSGQLADLSTLNTTIASQYITSSQLASTTQTLLGDIYSTPNAFASSASTVQSEAIKTTALFAKFFVPGVISTVDLYSTQANLMSTVSGFNTANLVALSNYQVVYASTTTSVLREYGAISTSMFGLSNYNTQQYSTLSTLLAAEHPRQSTLDGGLRVSNIALSNRFQLLVDDYATVSSYYNAFPPSTIQLSSFSTLVGSQFNVQAATMAALTQDISALSHALLTETTTKAQLSSLSATFAQYQGVLPTAELVSSLSSQIFNQTASVAWLSSYVHNFIPPQSALQAIETAAAALSAPFSMAQFSSLSTSLGIEDQAISTFAGTTAAIYAPNDITPQYTMWGIGNSGNRYFAGNDVSGATILTYPSADPLTFKYVHSSDRIILMATTDTLYYYEGSRPRRALTASTVLQASGFFTASEIADIDYGYLGLQQTWIAGTETGAFKRSPDGKRWTDIPTSLGSPPTPKCILAPKLNNTNWYILSHNASPQLPTLYITTDFINYTTESIGTLLSRNITAADSLGDKIVVGTATGQLFVRTAPSTWQTIDLSGANYFRSINTIKYIPEKTTWILSGTRSINGPTVVFWSRNALTWTGSIINANIAGGPPVIVSWTGAEWLAVASVVSGLQVQTYAFISTDLVTWHRGPELTNSIIPTSNSLATNRSLTTLNYKPPTPAELCLSSYTNNISTLYGDYTLNNISSGHMSSLSTSFGEVPVKGNLASSQLTSTFRGIYNNPVMTEPLVISSQIVLGTTQLPSQGLTVSWDQGTQIKASELTLTAPLVALPNMNVYKQRMYVGQGQTQMLFSMGADAVWQTGTSTIRGMEGLKSAGVQGQSQTFYCLQNAVGLLKSVDGILWQQVDLSASRGFQTLTVLETDVSQGVVIAGRKGGVVSFAQSLPIDGETGRIWRNIPFRVAPLVRPLAEISVLKYNPRQPLWVAGGVDSSGQSALFWTTDISASNWTRSTTIPPGKPTQLINRSTSASSSATVWLVGTDQTATPTQTSTFFSLDGRVWQVCSDAFIAPTNLAVSPLLWMACGSVLLKNTGSQIITGFAYSLDGRNWDAARTGAESVRGLCVEYVEATDTWIGFAEDAVYLGTYYFMQSTDGINWQRGQRVPERVSRLVESAYNTKVSIYDTLRVAGNLVKATGYFEIEHPLEPSVRGLRHSFVEGPTRGDNIYRYTVITDSAGNARVDLPDYYPYLNESPMIWLTAVGGKARAFATYDANQNAVLISTQGPQVTLNVLVIGTRKDEAAKQAFDARGGVEFMRYPGTQ